MSDSSKNDCTHPETHHLHICQLRKRGLNDEIAARTNKPGFICNNCNATANSAEDLCNCSPFINRS